MKVYFTECQVVQFPTVKSSMSDVDERFCKKLIRFTRMGQYFFLDFGC